MGFNPVVAGINLPAGPFEPAALAIPANIPLMIGTNEDEMTLFLAFAPWLDELDEASARERARTMVGQRGMRSSMCTGERDRRSRGAI
jgi:para-nitrobenzyl esterase